MTENKNYRKENRDPSTLKRSRSLADNYSIHDVGEMRARRLITNAGLIPVAWGIDARNATGNVIFEESAADLLVFKAKDKANQRDIDLLQSRGEKLQELRSIEAKGEHDETAETIAERKQTVEELFNELAEEKFELITVLEVKSKSSKEWFGIINDRHHEKYKKIVEDKEKPFWIYMCQVDDNEVIFEEMIPVIENEKVRRKDEITCRYVPDDGICTHDGNEVVEFPEDEYRSITEFLAEVSIENEEIEPKDIQMENVKGMWLYN